MLSHAGTGQALACSERFRPDWIGFLTMCTSGNFSPYREVLMLMNLIFRRISLVHTPLGLLPFESLLDPPQPIAGLEDQVFVQQGLASTRSSTFLITEKHQGMDIVTDFVLRKCLRFFLGYYLNMLCKVNFFF